MTTTSSSQAHVLFLPRWYPHRYDPVFGLFVERHALAVSKNVDVSVLYVHADTELKHKIYDLVLSQSGLFVVRIYFKKCTFKPAFLANIINLYRFLSSHLRGYKHIKKHQRKVDLVHVHILTRLGVVALIKKIFCNTPYVITEHWSRYLDYTNSYSGIIRKLTTEVVVKNSSAVSVVSHNLEKAMKSHRLNHPRYFILNNVVDTDLFRIQENRNEEVKVNFIHVSCFEDRSKNISGLLNVLLRLREKRNDFRCTMVGTGIDFEMLRKQASEMGLEPEHVVFAGLLEGEAIVKTYRQSAFLVMFSNYENMPVVISEAFACGMPVLATSVGGIPEHVNSERGMLVSPRDEQDLLDKLDFMIDHYKDFDKQKIRDYAVHQFSRQSVAMQLEKMYSFALAK